MSYEIELAIGSCESPWDLVIEDEEMATASYLKSWEQYIRAFFSSAHEASLKERLITLLEDEEDQILLEKIGAIARRNQRSWFYGIEALGPAELLCVHQGIQDFPGQITPVIEGGRYRNYPGEDLFWQFWETQRLLFVGARDAVTHLEDLEEAFTVYPEIIPRYLGADPFITWIGHATLLIQVGGVNILTDPSFGFVFPCFMRHILPAVSREELPFIDLILCSHNHGDHANQLDYFSRFQTEVFSGAQTQAWLEGMGFQRIHENAWWQSTLVYKEGQEIKITAVPAQHGSQLGLFDANKMLWCGFVIEVGDKILYFAGDTALGVEMVDQEGIPHPLFEQIKAQFGTIDVAFLPIAPEGEPNVHIDHKEALLAFQALGAKEIVPIHWGAYRTGKEKIEEPIQLFMEEAERLGLQDQVRMLKVGESFICGMPLDTAMVSYSYS